MFSLILGSLLRNTKNCWKSYLKDGGNEVGLRCCCLLLFWQSVETIDSGAKGSRSRTGHKGREQVYEKWGDQEPPVTDCHSLEELPVLFPQYFLHSATPGCIGLLSDSWIDQPFLTWALAQTTPCGQKCSSFGQILTLQFSAQISLFDGWCVWFPICSMFPRTLHFSTRSHSNRVNQWILKLCLLFPLLHLDSNSLKTVTLKVVLLDAQPWHHSGPSQTFSI